jgi:hypothetical protein
MAGTFCSNILKLQKIVLHFQVSVTPKRYVCLVPFYLLLSDSSTAVYCTMIHMSSSLKKKKGEEYLRIFVFEYAPSVA